MKTKHITVRLDDETTAIVEKYQAQFGTQTSETISRLIRAADGAKFVTVISTSIAHTEELSFFAGQLEKTKTLWREIKSRLNAPRPIDPADVESLKQWRADREKIQRFYSECDALWKFSHSLAASLTETTLADLQKIQRVLALLNSWVVEYKQEMNQKTQLQEKECVANTVRNLEGVIALLNRLGGIGNKLI